MKYSAVGSLTGLTTPAGAYSYGCDHAVRRAVKKQPLGSDRVRFRYGVGADVLEEKVFENGSVPHTLQYVYFGGMKVAALHTDASDSVTTLRLHNDRMGTVRMVSEDDDAVARVILNQDLHFSVWQSMWNDDILNRQVVTEGFDSISQCQIARLRVEEQILMYSDFVHSVSLFNVHGKLEN